MFELLFLSAAVWLSYLGVINSGFVSDDIEGLVNYDGKLKKFDYGHLNKWILYKLFNKSPQENHRFSILLHNANVILLFSFLVNFLPIKAAFYASLLFAVHPICIQSIAWISGRGYPIGLFFCLLNFNFIAISQNNPLFTSTAALQSLNLAILTIAYGCFYYVAVNAQFACLMTFAIQAFFGNYYLSVMGLIISAVTGFGIVKEVIGLRTKVFKEQNLEKSTKLKPQKIIVAIKTLAYYTRLCLFPKRMGLYHTFEYHYSEKTEKEDKWFWFGFFILLGLVAGFIYGSFIIKLGILWYLAYIMIFLNWVTIHQFVSERYLYIASIGLFILSGYCLFLLDGFLFAGFPVLMALIGGILIARTWVHLPTYQDEVLFYQSNIWNFPDSEVAFSNLGVVYMKCKLIGSAVDMWQIAIKINPQYDVAYYNISSVLKQKGDFIGAREYLKKAVETPQCHFKELWGKELESLEHEINYSKENTELGKRLLLLEADPAKKSEVQNIRKQLDEINNLHKKFEESQKQNLVLVQREEKQLKERLVQLDKEKIEFSKPLNMEILVKARDNNFILVKETVDRMLKIENTNKENTSNAKT